MNNLRAECETTSLRVPVHVALQNVEVGRWHVSLELNNHDDELETCEMMITTIVSNADVPEEIRDHPKKCQLYLRNYDISTDRTLLNGATHLNKELKRKLAGTKGFLLLTDVVDYNGTSTPFRDPDASRARNVSHSAMGIKDK